MVSCADIQDIKKQDRILAQSINLFFLLFKIPDSNLFQLIVRGA